MSKASLDVLNMMLRCTIFWCLAGWCALLPPSVLAQQIEAEITALEGDVFISLQGDAPLPAVEGVILLEGDLIRTYENARAALSLSDGSILRLGAQTNLEFTTMTARAENTSTLRLDLGWGSLRAQLSSAHRQNGSSCFIQTPNAQIYSTASAFDVELQYDPKTRATYVLGRTFSGTLTNLSSGLSQRIPPGHSAIIQDGGIQHIARIIQLPAALNTYEQTAQIKTLEGHVSVAPQGEKMASAFPETVIQAGDALQTGSHSGAILALADGTLIALQAESHLRIVTLIKTPRENIWSAEVELLRGEIRTVLDEGFRNDESSFLVFTPQARLAIHPARQMDTEVLYDPSNHLTTVMAHKSGVDILQLLTDDTAQLSPGHSAIIHAHTIQQIARILRPLTRKR